MYQISQPILVPAVATDDQPGPLVFLAVTNKFDIATQNLKVPPAMQKKKKKRRKRKLQLIAVRLLILQKTIKQWVSYFENICHLLGYDVSNHVCLMY